MNKEEVVKALMNQFGEDVPIGRIAKYAEDEFLIPYEEAVVLIYELA